jgi:hypothetical protein
MSAARESRSLRDAAVTDGVVEERCELFAARDQLVATSSQWAMVRFPSRDSQ